MKIKIFILFFAVVFIGQAFAQENIDSSEANTQDPVMGLVLANGLRIRKDMNTGSRVLGYFSRGMRIKVIERSGEKQIIEEEEDYWYKVELPEGEAGWVFGIYLIVEEKIQEVEGWVGDYVVNIRDFFGLGTKVIERIQWGERFKVIAKTDKKMKVEDEEDFWYKIRLSGGQTGWIFGPLFDMEFNQ